MASQKTVEIAVVAKTYGGAEGARVKAGTRFAVGKEIPGMVTITKARYDALKQNNIVRPFDEKEDTAADGRARYGEGFTRTEETGGGGVKLARNIRTAARQRARQPENPPAPAPLKRETGSQTGGGKASASSPGGQASGSSTSTSRGSRGNRGGSASSPSTTPSR